MELTESTDESGASVVFGAFGVIQLVECRFASVCAELGVHGGEGRHPIAFLGVETGDASLDAVGTGFLTSFEGGFTGDPVEETLIAREVDFLGTSPFDKRHCSPSRM